MGENTFGTHRSNRIIFINNLPQKICIPNAYTLEIVFKRRGQTGYYLACMKN